MRCVYEIVRIFTSFATIVTSISGQSFIQSAKTVTHVCRRNGYGMHASRGLSVAICRDRTGWTDSVTGATV